MQHTSIENKSVFPVVSTERRGNYTWDTNYQKLDKRIQPLTLAEIQSLKDDGVSVPAVVNEGAILMRHPYHPKELIDINFDNALYIQEKFGDYAVILNYLGAKDQTLFAKITKRETRTVKADGKIRCKGKFSLKGTFKRFTKEHYEVKFSKHITGTDECLYEKAAEKARELGLINDPFVKEILALRKDKPISTYNCDVVISKDYNDIIDAAANLSVMAGTFGLDGTFQKRIARKEQISISQKLIFE